MENETKHKVSKLNPDVKEKLLKALRSGQYKQETGQLRKNDRFCCLGVLCDLYRLEHNDSEWLPDGLFRVDEEDVDYLQYEAVLPEKVMAWAELEKDILSDEVHIPRNHESYSERIQEIVKTPGKTTLTLLNDKGASFEEIADVIEAVL